jgi:hypothetical protein
VSGHDKWLSRHEYLRDAEFTFCNLCPDTGSACPDKTHRE